MDKEKIYKDLLEMLDYNSDMYNFIEDMNLSVVSYNYWKRNHITDVIGVLTYLSNIDNKIPSKIKKETVGKIYNNNKDLVLSYLDKVAAQNKIEYYEKQIKILKIKYGI